MSDNISEILGLKEAQKDIDKLSESMAKLASQLEKVTSNKDVSQAKKIKETQELTTLQKEYIKQ